MTLMALIDIQTPTHCPARQSCIKMEAWKHLNVCVCVCRGGGIRDSDTEVQKTNQKLGENNCKHLIKDLYQSVQKPIEIKPEVRPGLRG